MFVYTSLKSKNDRTTLNRFGTDLYRSVRQGYDGMLDLAAFDLLTKSPDMKTMMTDLIDQLETVAQAHNLKYFFQQIPKQKKRSKKRKKAKKEAVLKLNPPSYEKCIDAAKTLLLTLGHESGYDPTTFQGFDKLRFLITRKNRKEIAVDSNGRSYEQILRAAGHTGSYTHQFLDLFMTDPDFRDVAQHSPMIWDFRWAVHWKDKGGNPTRDATDASRILWDRVAEKYGIDWRKENGFYRMVSLMSGSMISDEPISDFGTTLESLFSNVHRDSAESWLGHLISRDPDFQEYRKVDWREYLNTPSSVHTVGKKSIKLAPIHPHIYKAMMMIAKENRLDPTNPEQLKRLLPHLTPEEFRKKANGTMRHVLKSLVPLKHKALPFALMYIFNKYKEFDKVRQELGPLQTSDFSNQASQ